MKRILSICTFLVVSTLAIVSCKKGDTGNANVMYSEWFTPTPYIKDTVFGIWGFKFNKEAPKITQQMLDSSAILVFAKLLGYNPAVWPTGQVAQMPISITYMQGGVTTDTWSALASVGNIRIRFVNDRNIYNVIATQHQFRYMIIPASTKVNSRVAQKTYEEICREYNIPE